MSRDGALTTFQRFFSHVDTTGEHWLWTGSLSDGYGAFGAGGKSYRAHRWLYEAVMGPLGDRDIDHLCSVRNCVRLDHLEGVSRAVNIQRTWLRGRGRWKSNRTHCLHGHPWIKGSPRCTTCRKGETAARAAARVAARAALPVAAPLTWRSDGLRSPYDAAVRKGAEARAIGVTRGQNPYHESHAINRYGIAAARTWRNAWFKGWDAPPQPLREDAP